MGNSLGVGIPKEVVDELNIKQGDEYEVTADPKTGVITARPVKKIVMGEGLTPEMKDELKDIFKRYDETLKNLKDR